MRIVTVCRSGSEYGEHQANYLHKQITKYDSVCLTDLPLPGIATLPLRYQYPGWWSKMELFDPEGPLGNESFLFMDLDTKVLGNINILMDAVAGRRNLVMLRDFYRTSFYASGVMYVSVECKAAIWSHWRANFRQFMEDRRKRGDGGVIAKLAPTISTWEHLTPGRIISYKKHVVSPSNRWYCPGQSVGNGKMPRNAILCCYHGQPRPWSPE